MKEKAVIEIISNQGIILNLPSLLLLPFFSTVSFFVNSRSYPRNLGGFQISTFPTPFEEDHLLFLNLFF